MRIDHGLLPGHVLQRTPHGARVTVSGICTASGPVTASVRAGAKVLPKLKAVRVGRAGDGRFTATLAGVPAGGPYTVELSCGAERVEVGEIFVGDLWLMAGQSNMQGVGDLAGAPEPHPLVRCFTMGRYWEEARDPLHLLDESPDRAHGGTGLDRAAARRAKRNAVKGVGVGVHFGRLMQARSGVPQGLIATAHGGTSMAQWDPALKEQGGDSLYGSMTLSLQAVGQPLAGVLWYQGCSDTQPAAAAVYTKAMQELVAAVRRDCGQPRLPWAVVQIGRVVNSSNDAAVWNAIQEQQRRLPESIPALDVVPSADLELDDLIHISSRSFPALAERLARVAARLALGDRSEKPAPQPRSVRLLPGQPGKPLRIEVRVANAVGGLASPVRPLGFSVVDQRGRARPAVFRTELAGDRVLLHLTESDIDGHRVGYGLGTDPACTVSDQRGMALPVFGPLAIEGVAAEPLPISDWFLRWRVSPILPGEDIAKLPRPDGDEPGTSERSYTPDFVNNHDWWPGNSGHVAFTTTVELAEAGEVEVRAGYDGPFRLWVGASEIHRDLKGTNPAIKDAHRLRVRLPAGRHPVSVLLALNRGMAWGFFLRMAAAIGRSAPQPWA